MGCAASSQSSNVVGEGGQKSTTGGAAGGDTAAGEAGAKKVTNDTTPPTTSTEGEAAAAEKAPKSKPSKSFTITCSHKDTKPNERHISQLSGSAVLGDLKVRYGCYSQRGKDADDATKPNQDSYSILLQQQQQQQQPATATSTSNDDDDKNNNNEYIFWGVYDGHGPQGEPCSQFVGETLPNLIQQHVKIATAKQRRQQQQRSSSGGEQQQTPICLSQAEIHHALHAAHTECNDDLHMSQINDSYSGTTSISIYLHSDNRITVSNVGDSRAVLGTRTDPTAPTLVGVPLSRDQTPHRPEEAQRCIRRGARILSFGQINPSPDDDPDEDDPPRVWSKKGKFPGTAFTRSMGDAVAEQLGVFAEPEVMTVKLTSKEKLLVLASDGVFDVLDNQQVVDMICQTSRNNNTDTDTDGAVADPLVACRAIIEKSHEEWLLNEGSPPEDQANYDDMTIICVFISSSNTNEKEDDFWTVPKAPPTEEAPPTAGGAAGLENAATNDSNNEQQQESNEEEGAIPRKKRVRQKTLRNLEEMAEETGGE